MAQVGLQWEDSAKEEVRDIYDYHYDRSIDYAEHWSDEVVKKVNGFNNVRNLIGGILEYRK